MNFCSNYFWEILYMYLCILKNTLSMTKNTPSVFSTSYVTSASQYFTATYLCIQCKCNSSLYSTKEEKIRCLTLIFPLFCYLNFHWSRRICPIIYLHSKKNIPSNKEMINSLLEAKALCSMLWFLFYYICVHAICVTASKTTERACFVCLP